MIYTGNKMIGINKVTMSKPFKPTTLYIKTHNKTGLKYFGKTTGDPCTYRGSGKHWLAHLRKHGNDVTTEVYGHYTIKDECVKAAIDFSVANNIVTALNENNKKIWANQIIENGTDGGATGRTNYRPHTAESKNKMSLSRKGVAPWNKGKKGTGPGNTTPRTAEEKQKLREANLGKKQTAETIAKRSKSLQGHQVTQETRNKISNAHTGKIVSDATKEKQRNVVRTQEQKDHLRKINLGKKAAIETKQKLSGYVVAINKRGELSRIPKNQYYAQTGPKDEWEWVSHKSKEAATRKLT